MVDDHALTRNVLIRHAECWGCGRRARPGGEEALLQMRGAADAGDPFAAGGCGPEHAGYGRSGVLPSDGRPTAGWQGYG